MRGVGRDERLHRRRRREQERGRGAGEGPQRAAILVGLPSVVAATGFKALAKLVDRNGDVLLREAVGLSPPELLASPLFHLSYTLGTAVVLVGLGLLFARDAERKAPYRVLELAGLVLFFGVLTVLSLARHRELLYPALVFGGGVAAFAVGARERHVLLVVVPAAFLVLQGWIQYFAKLSDFPLGVLLMGFGLGTLGSAVVFERKVRPRLGELGGWA